MVALGQPILLMGLVVRQVEGMPALLRDFKRAHVGFAAIGLVSRHDGQALVVDLEELCVGKIEVLSRRIVGNILLKCMRDQGRRLATVRAV